MGIINHLFYFGKTKQCQYKSEGTEIKKHHVIRLLSLLLSNSEVGHKIECELRAVGFKNKTKLSVFPYTNGGYQQYL